MFEHFALNVFHLLQDSGVEGYSNQRLWPLLLGLLGASIFWCTVSSRETIHRSSYFPIISLLLVISSLVEFIWLMANDAIIKGYLSILVYSWITYYVVFGFYLGKFASARSKDAFGHGKLAFIAFLPLLNFILLLKKPKTDQGFTHMKVASIFQGKIGIAVGFLLLFAFATSGAIQTQLSASMAKKVSVADANAILSKTINAIGLERSLLDIAKTTRVPIRVDKDTVLSKISASEKSLIREFKVSNPSFKINENVRVAIYNFVCSHEYFRLLGGKGMVLEERYTRPDGSTIGSVEVDFNYCP